MPTYQGTALTSFTKLPQYFIAK